jgi:hypothetical protein
LDSCLEAGGAAESFEHGGGATVGREMLSRRAMVSSVIPAAKSWSWGLRNVGELEPDRFDFRVGQEGFPLHPAVSECSTD